MRQPRKFILIALVAACMLMLLTVMSGCRPSDALKEIIYDQTSDIVDYDNEQKFLISNDQSEIEDETVPSEEITDTKEETDEKQNIVVYGSEPNSPDFTAKQSLWSMIPDFEGIEASAKVKFYESRDPNASKQRLKTDNPLDESDDSDDTSWDVEEGSELDDDKEGTAESETSSNIDADPSSAGGNGSSGNGKTKVADESANSGNNITSDLTGSYVKPPHVNSIAAYGDYAVLVQMIGGNGALAAADKTLLSGDFKKKVFTKASIKTAWSNDGSSASKIDTDAIIKSGAEALLVTSGSYLSDKQFKALDKKGIEVCQVSKMTTSTNIKKDAELIGEMLSESKGIQYDGKTEDRASEYTEWYDDLITECCKAANGDEKTLPGKRLYEGGSGNSQNKKWSKDNTNVTYTLLIDDYDTSAYRKSQDGWTPAKDGAALSTVGYKTTPVSFYIQAGGLVNTAAYCGGSTSGQIIVWQFNSNVFDFDKKNWDYSSGGAVDKSIRVQAGSDASAWDKSLLTAAYGTGGSDPASSLAAANNFGTDNFPKAIAATQQIKKQFINNSKDSNGIYHPYGKATGSSQNFCGIHTSGGSNFYSTVGVDNKTQIFDDKGQIPDECVEVNPHGLFSSWTEGGSPESVLEAAWVNDVVNDDSESTGWENYVEDFYKKFYEYTLTSSDKKTIEAGAEK